MEEGLEDQGDQGDQGGQGEGDGMLEVEVDTLNKGKIPELAHVPASPVQADTSVLLQTKPSIQPEEAYSKDEEALNTFLKLHPMLSLCSFACYQTHARTHTHTDARVAC